MHEHTLAPALQRAGFAAGRRTIATALLVVGVAALGGCAHYEAQPLSATAVQRSLQERSLDAPELHALVQEQLHRTAPPWDFAALTLAAWYFSPELDKARAEYQARSAAVITAGQGPLPTLVLPFEYNTTPKSGESPYTLGLGLDIPVETAGKRDYRVASARASSLAARFDIDASAWRVRRQLRAQLLALWDARARVRLLEAQLALRERLVQLVERRQALGEAAATELELARAQLASEKRGLLQAGREEAQALAAAAGAIGLPARALRTQALDLRNFGVPARAPQRDTLADAALRNRADVQAELARYEASQSALQLAVANQYPDIHLGPGYTFDAGAHKLAFNLSGLPLPIPRDNRGPIAEAAAHRRLVATQVQATIASALGEIDRAFAGWEAANDAWRATRAEVDSRERLAQEAAEALRLGEADRPTLLRTELDVGTARLDAQQALLELQRAAGAIEDAVQQPASRAADAAASADLRG